MAQTKDLFGNMDIQTIDLIIPDKKKLEAASNLLNNLYNKNELVNIYEAFRRWTSGKVFRMVDEDGLLGSQKLLSGLAAKQNQRSKLVYMDFLGALLADKRNMAVYFKYMPKNSQKLMREVMLRGCMSLKEARKIADIPKNTRSYYSYYSSQLSNEFSWFTLTNFGYYYYSNSEDNYYIYIGSRLYKYFLPVVLPEAYRPLQTIDKLDGEDWETSNFEHEAFRDVPLIEGMFTQGVISPGKSKLLMAPTEKKIDQIGMADFPFSKKGESTRGRKIAAYLAMVNRDSILGFDGVTLPVQTQACNVVRRINPDRGSWFQVCVPFVSGTTKKSIVDASNAITILRYVASFLRSFSKAGWLSVEDIFAHMYLNLMENGNKTFAFEPNRYNMGALPENKFSNETIMPDHNMEGLTKPLIRGFLCFLASWGILETASKKGEKCYNSPYDTIQYVRATALGRYALGIDKEYIAPKEEKKVWFELDDERLIFRSLSDDNPYTVILNDMSNSIGGGRYEVTAESFLSHCATRADVEQKIDIFKQYIGRELPQVWKDFFAEMLRHCQPLEKLPITNYKMYRVAKDNTSLQRLLTTDEKLRSLVIRAEGYRILVEKSDIVKFENRLKSFGYLL